MDTSYTLLEEAYSNVEKYIYLKYRPQAESLGLILESLRR
jgi:hypothetical protein